jgi:branched-chain amino acid transport system substrate-binding protein
MNRNSMRLSRRLLATSAATVLALALAACGGEDSGGGGKKEDLKVAFVTALSGPQGTNGTASFNAGKAYAAMVNSKGGIDGHKLVIKGGDTQGNPTLAPGLARKLVEGDKVLMVNGFATPDATAVLPYLKARKITAVTTSPSATLIEDPESPYRLFGASYYDMAAQQIEYAVKTLGLKRIAIAYVDDGVGAPAKDAMRKELAKSGLKPVAEVTYSPTASNLTAQAAELKASNAEFVLANHATAVITPIVKASARVDFHPIWGLSSSAVASDTISALGADLDGKAYASTGYILPDSEDAATYRTWLTKEGQDPSNNIAVGGWATMEAVTAVLTKAVKAADGGTPSLAQIRAASEDISFDTDTLKGVTWSKGKHAGASKAQVLAMKDGKWVTVQDFQPMPGLS